MARGRRREEQPQEAASLRHYRVWAVAKANSKESQEEVALATKAAIQATGVSKQAWNWCCKLKSMEPLKAQAVIRDVKRLVSELGLEDQGDMLERERETVDSEE